MKIRLTEVAAQAEVSEATVSRVLNGKPGVSEATRAAVLTAIDVLGYEVPVKLRPRSGALVGLIVPELTNPIFPAFAQTIETGLAMRGFTPVLCTQTPGGLHEDVYVQMLLDRGVAGIICVRRAWSATPRWSTRASRSCWSTATARGCGRPSSPATPTRRSSCRCGT